MMFSGAFSFNPLIKVTVCFMDKNPTMLLLVVLPTLGVLESLALLGFGLLVPLILTRLSCEQSA